MQNWSASTSPPLTGEVFSKALLRLPPTRRRDRQWHVAHTNNPSWLAGYATTITARMKPKKVMKALPVDPTPPSRPEDKNRRSQILCWCTCLDDLHVAPPEPSNTDKHVLRPVVQVLCLSSLFLCLCLYWVLLMQDKLQTYNHLAGSFCCSSWSTAKWWNLLDAAITIIISVIAGWNWSKLMKLEMVASL